MAGRGEFLVSTKAQRQEKDGCVGRKRKSFDAIRQMERGGGWRIGLDSKGAREARKGFNWDVT